jgi:hypothetical protein
VFNNLINDIIAEITDSLSRSGKGGMLVPFEFSDGAVGAPAATFSSETNSGLYRAGANDIRFSLAGIDLITLTAALIKFVARVADGASAVGLELDTTNAITNAGAKLFRVLNNAVEKFYLDKDGNVLGGGLFRALAAVGATLKGNVADGASAVGVILDNVNALADAAAKALSVRSAGTERFSVFGAGGIGIEANSKRVKIAGPATLAADYDLELPSALPATTQVLTLSPAGLVAASGVPTPVAAGDGANKGYVDKTAQISASSGSFTVTGGTPVDVTNLSVTITTRGRPVMLALISGEPTVTPSFLGVEGAAATSIILWIYFFRDSTEISRTYGIERHGASLDVDILVHNSILHIDTPSAGTYTYKVQAGAAPSVTGHVRAMKLVAVEL